MAAFLRGARSGAGAFHRTIRLEHRRGQQSFICSGQRQPTDTGVRALPDLSALNSGQTAQKGRRLVLASTSPRRHELIKHLNLSFEVIPSQVEEPFDEDANPEELVIGLAIEKANDVYTQL